MVPFQSLDQLTKTSRRITICQEDSDTGPRIGGNPSEGIEPSFVGPATRYFLTVPFGDSSTQEVSLFVSIDWDDKTCYEPANQSSLWNTVSKLRDIDCLLVQCVVHQNARRSSSARLTSDLGGRALLIEDERPDIVAEPGGELLLPSKIGGRPYYYYGTPSYIQSVERLFEEGFCLFLQMTLPGLKESPQGN